MISLSQPSSTNMLRIPTYPPGDTYPILIAGTQKSRWFWVSFPRWWGIHFCPGGYIRPLVSLNKAGYQTLISRRGRLTSHDESIKGKKRPCYFRQSWHFECLGSAPYWAPCSASSHSPHVLGWPSIVSGTNGGTSWESPYLSEQKKHLLVFFLRTLIENICTNQIESSSPIVRVNISKQKYLTHLRIDELTIPLMFLSPFRNFRAFPPLPKTFLSTGSVDCKLFYIYL